MSEHNDVQAADNREFVRQIYAAASNGDVGPLFAAMSPDFVAHEAESLPWGGTHRGLEENQRLVETLSQYIDFTTLNMTHFLVDRELVIALGSVVWRADSRVVPLAECWEIRDGKAASLRPFFWDTAALVGT